MWRTYAATRRRPQTIASKLIHKNGEFLKKRNGLMSNELTSEHLTQSEVWVCRRRKKFKCCSVEVTSALWIHAKTECRAHSNTAAHTGFTWTWKSKKLSEKLSACRRSANDAMPWRGSGPAVRPSRGELNELNAVALYGALKPTQTRLCLSVWCAPAATCPHRSTTNCRSDGQIFAYLHENQNFIVWRPYRSPTESPTRRRDEPNPSR